VRFVAGEPLREGFYIVAAPSEREWSTNNVALARDLHLVSLLTSMRATSVGAPYHCCRIHTGQKKAYFLTRTGMRMRRDIAGHLEKNPSSIAHLRRQQPAEVALEHMQNVHDAGLSHCLGVPAMNVAKCSKPQKEALLHLLKSVAECIASKVNQAGVEAVEAAASALCAALRTKL
jgi:hypothetical protein